MPLDFPNTPSTNDTYSSGGRTWQYNGTSWVLQSLVGVIGAGAVGTAELAANAVTSAKIADETIVNADIATNAAVAYSKLSLSNSVVNADIATTAAINSTKITNWEDDQVVLSSQVFDS